jgi:hypothetical protein
MNVSRPEIRNLGPGMFTDESYILPLGRLKRCFIHHLSSALHWPPVQRDTVTSNDADSETAQQITSITTAQPPIRAPMVGYLAGGFNRRVAHRYSCGNPRVMPAMDKVNPMNIKGVS